MNEKLPDSQARTIRAVFGILQIHFERHQTSRVKIIIDEHVSHIVKKRLPECQNKNVQGMNRAGVKNRELLNILTTANKVTKN